MKRTKPKQHSRRLSTGRSITVNKGVRKTTRKRTVIPGNRNTAVAIIKNLMKENRSLARERGKITAKQDNLYPLSLSVRDGYDKEENLLQRKGRTNRDRIAFLENKYELDVKNY
jgi:hypothetical protein